MLTLQSPLEQLPGYPLEREYDINRLAFFDIETTGFAAEATYLYLIGCAYYKAGSFHLIQWFSEGIREEKLVLAAFFEFLRDYDVLIHYNGTGFDIPYLNKKIAQLQLPYSFEGLTSVDLYKKITPYKKILKLDSFKLKSLEEFLGLHRKDTFNGGDLIQVYSGYLGKKHYETLWNLRNPNSALPSPTESDLLLELLLSHNADDLRGLVSICPILYYSDLFERPIRILQAVVEEGFLHLRFELSALLPSAINYGNDLTYLTAHKNTALLKVRIYEGELKHFYDNYKDYYYLPAEDYAIHKSVANFVDKEHRIKAKPSNCYRKKTGIFAPQQEPLITPYFKMNHPDRLSFLEIHTDFLLQEENLERYVKHLLAYMIAK